MNQLRNHNNTSARGPSAFIRTRGRPTKLTSEVAKQIVSAIVAGNYIETAAAYAGVGKSALYNWLKRGRKKKSSIHGDFVDAVEKALAEAEVRDVKRIGDAAKDQWQAAAWRLERKFPNRWGRRLALTGADGGAIKTEARHVLDVTKLNDGDLEALEGILARATGESTNGDGTGEAEEMLDP